MCNSYHKVPEYLKGMVSTISRKSICCSIFPTNIVKVEELIIKDTDDEFVYKIVKHNNLPMLAKINAFFGVYMSPEDYIVPMTFVDTTNANKDVNLGAHGFINEDGEWHHFPSHIPLNIIRTIKEGDTFEVDGDHGEFSITAAQSTPKYKNRNRFEDVLNELIKLTTSR